MLCNGHPEGHRNMLDTRVERQIESNISLLWKALRYIIPRSVNSTNQKTRGRCGCFGGSFGGSLGYFRENLRKNSGNFRYSQNGLNSRISGAGHGEPALNGRQCPEHFPHLFFVKDSFTTFPSSYDRRILDDCWEICENPLNPHPIKLCSGAIRKNQPWGWSVRSCLVNLTCNVRFTTFWIWTPSWAFS